MALTSALSGAANLLGGGGGAAAGAGMAALGPWMLGATALQGGFQALGGVMEQKAADKAIEEANKNRVRDWGFSLYAQDREKANQMAALREGNYFMQSPIYQQNKKQDFSQGFMLAGKLDPYLTAMASRFG